MEGRINKEGILEIKRGNKFKMQACPYTVNQLSEGMSIKMKTNRCGHWCPLFGEPEDNVIMKHKSVMDREIKKDGFILELCHKELKFEKFEDLR